MNLHQYIRDEIEHGSTLQPSEIAAVIYDRMNEAQRAEAFAVALPALVRQVIVGTRPSTQRALADGLRRNHGGPRRADRSRCRVHRARRARWDAGMTTTHP